MTLTLGLGLFAGLIVYSIFQWHEERTRSRAYGILPGSLTPYALMQLALGLAILILGLVVGADQKTATSSIFTAACGTPLAPRENIVIQGYEIGDETLQPDMLDVENLERQCEDELSSSSFTASALALGISWLLVGLALGVTAAVTADDRAKVAQALRQREYRTHAP